jgi:hypothetical protein
MNQNLFRYEQVIFKGSHKLSPRTHEWPFSFELPETIKVPFAAELQAAPPTWDVLQVARVVYSLRLVVNPNRNYRSMEIERMIKVWPFRTIELPLPTPLMHDLQDPMQKASWRHALARRRSSTVAQDAAAAFARRRSSTVTSFSSTTQEAPTQSRTPTASSFVSSNSTADIKLAISLPQSAGAWQKFSIQLLASSSACCTPRNLTLTHVELCLKAQAIYSATHSSHRTPNTSTPQHGTSGLYIAKFKLLGRGLQIPVTNTPVTIKHNMQLTDMTRGDASILVPDFGISYFKLQYVMEVCVVGIVVDDGEGNGDGEGSVIERKGEVPFVILPGPVVQEVASEEEDAPPGFHDSVSPPCYESGGMWESRGAVLE